MARMHPRALGILRLAVSEAPTSENAADVECMQRRHRAGWGAEPLCRSGMLAFDTYLHSTCNSMPKLERLTFDGACSSMHQLEVFNLP